MSHQMPLGASILPFFDHLITLLPSYVTTVAGFAIFVTMFLSHYGLTISVPDIISFSFLMPL